jgi:two-component system, OmpR family, sensor histidine kinase TctE
MEEREPHDLTEIAPAQAPQEVRPLVDTLNQLFGTVSAQSAQQRRFVADAAHQLRTPLAALQSQVEAWAKAAETDGGVFLPNAELDRLRSATRRTSGLVNQLLALSRADAQAMRAQPREEVNLRELAEDVLSDALDEAARRGIDLGLDAHDVRASGIAWMLREVLSNLVDNALRYTPQGGRVTVRCRAFTPADAAAFRFTPSDARERALLEVEDSGPGIPEAERGKVVGRFYRVAGSPGDGTGLGLAIANEIASAHDTVLLLADARDSDRTDAPTQARGLRAALALAVWPMPQ